MRKWILWIIVVSVMISMMTGCIGGSSGCNNSFNNLIGNSSFGGSGGSGGSGYSPAIGELDTSFNGTGFVVHNNAAGGNIHDEGNSIYVDSNGKIYVTGCSVNRNGDLDMVIWRYDEEGKLDKTFGEGGIVVHDKAAGGKGDDEGNAIYVDSNGKIYVTGYSYNGRDKDMVIWRYNSDGSIDKTFGEGGIVVHDKAAGGKGDDVGYSIYVDNRERIYVTGYSYNGRDYDMVIWRYNSDGSIDKTFGKGGIVVDNSAAGANGYDYGASINVDNKGRIYVTGYSASEKTRRGDMVIWRYNEEGKLDKTFGRTGRVIYNIPIPNNIFSFGLSTYIDRGGNIYVTGFGLNMSFEPTMVICRYNEDGTLDKTFANRGIVMYNKAIGTDIYVDNSGKIYVTGIRCGYFDFPESAKELNSDMMIWKYK